MDTSSRSTSDKHRTHAEHNEAVCTYLQQREEFADWIITTAFYSALHWVEYLIFPYAGTDKVFQSLDEYVVHQRRTNPAYSLSHHETRVRLFEANNRIAGAQFRWLKDLSRKSRYDTHLYAPTIVPLVRQNLTNIREFCIRSKQ